MDRPTGEQVAELRAALMDEDQACDEIYRARLEGGSLEPATRRFLAAHSVVERLQKRLGVTEDEIIDLELEGAL